MAEQRERLSDAPVADKVGSAGASKPATPPAAPPAAKTEPKAPPAKTEAPKPAAKAEPAKKKAPRPARPAKPTKVPENDGILRVMADQLTETVKFIRQVGGLANARALITTVEEIATAPLE